MGKIEGVTKINLCTIMEKENKIFTAPLRLGRQKLPTQIFFSPCPRISNKLYNLYLRRIVQHSFNVFKLIKPIKFGISYV